MFLLQFFFPLESTAVVDYSAVGPLGYRGYTTPCCGQTKSFLFFFSYRCLAFISVFPDHYDVFTCRHAFLFLTIPFLNLLAALHTCFSSFSALSILFETFFLFPSFFFSGLGCDHGVGVQDHGVQSVLRDFLEMLVPIPWTRLRLFPSMCFLPVSHQTLLFLSTHYYFFPPYSTPLEGGTPWFSQSIFIFTMRPHVLFLVSRVPTR